MLGRKNNWINLFSNYFSIAISDLFALLCASFPMIKKYVPKFMTLLKSYDLKSNFRILFPYSFFVRIKKVAFNPDIIEVKILFEYIFYSFNWSGEY